MNAREEVLSTLDALNESELREVAQFVQFIRFRHRVQPSTTDLDEKQLASLYAEAAPEDRALAASGLAEYGAALLREDSA